MRSGRARRLLGGLGLGYLHTTGSLLIGLWLTPFLLRQLGSHDYGLWLLGTQIVFYLGLMDLGVVALVPREVAGASGLPGGDREAAIRTLVGETSRIVLWQLPAVAIVGGVLLWLLPQEWALSCWCSCWRFRSGFSLRCFRVSRIWHSWERYRSPHGR